MSGVSPWGQRRVCPTPHVRHPGVPPILRPPPVIQTASAPLITFTVASEVCKGTLTAVESRSGVLISPCIHFSTWEMSLEMTSGCDLQLQESILLLLLGLLLLLRLCFRHRGVAAKCAGSHYVWWIPEQRRFMRDR